MTDENRALYNCIDAAVTLKVWNEINAELEAKKPGYRACYDQTIDLYGPAIFMSTYGMKLDLEKLEEERARITNEISICELELDQLTDGKLNPQSPKSCQRYFYGYLGLQPYTNNGKVTTDDKALARIARRGIKEASLVQKIRGLSKLKSTYLEVMCDADGRIRASWNLRGTGEGRLSSSQNIFNTGMNFQNLDPRFKSFIVADDDHVLVDVDKSQAEWVVVAYLSGDARMLEVIEKGLDPHIYTACLITRAPPKLLIQESKLLGHTTDADTIMLVRREKLPKLIEKAAFLPRTMTARQAGKKGNHGLNYREGYVTFALSNEIPETESKSIVEGYRSGYCNIPIWWDKTETELRKSRVLDNCFGRQRRFLDEWSDKLIRQAIAFRPQSTVADLTSKGMIGVYNDNESFMAPVRLCCHGHDSITFQYPKAHLGNLAKACIKVHDYMNPTLSYNGMDFQIGSDLKIGLNWGDQSDDNPEGMREVKFHKKPKNLADELKSTISG